MTSGVSLSVVSTAIILVSVIMLTGAATFILETRDLPERRGAVVFFLCLLVIWLLACAAAFVLSPSWWPNETI